MTAVLFQILFEYELLQKFNRKDFLPWLKKDKDTDGARKRKFAVDKDFLYFVKIEPRRNLFSFVRRENLTALWFFINQNFNKRSNRVIPQLE